MKKLTDNEKIDLSCEVTNTLAKQKRVEHYDVIAQSYGKTRLFDLKDDDLRKTHIEHVRTYSKEYMLSQPDIEYLGLLEGLVGLTYDDEEVRKDRTNTGTYSTFGYQMRFDLSKQFPILSTKKVYFKGVVAELLWFLRGDTNIQYLLKHKCSIWTDWRYKTYSNYCKSTLEPQMTIKEFEQEIINNDEFAKQWGDIGKGYGHQWRNFGETTSEYDDDYGQVIKDGFDQIKWVINEIKTNPTSRRLIVSGWNPHDINQVDLPPCHTLFQFYVQDGKLSCQLYQRSCDVFLGLPFNITSYALLTHIIAQECDLAVGEFVWSGGDVHLYANHIEQAKIQLGRTTLIDKVPQVFIPNKPFDQLEPNDIELFGYEPQSTIKAPVAV